MFDRPHIGENEHQATATDGLQTTVQGGRHIGKNNLPFRARDVFDILIEIVFLFDISIVFVVVTVFLSGSTSLFAETTWQTT